MKNKIEFTREELYKYLVSVLESKSNDGRYTTSTDKSIASDFSDLIFKDSNPPELCWKSKSTLPTLGHTGIYYINDALGCVVYDPLFREVSVVDSFKLRKLKDSTLVLCRRENTEE